METFYPLNWLHQTYHLHLSDHGRGAGIIVPVPVPQKTLLLPRLPPLLLLLPE
jgi:hypothetical protein